MQYHKKTGKMGTNEFFIHFLFAFGDQGALFEKTAPWTPAKTFD
jgi:hypothetical protein